MCQVSSLQKLYLSKQKQNRFDICEGLLKSSYKQAELFFFLITVIIQQQFFKNIKKDVEAIFRYKFIHHLFLSSFMQELFRS